VVEAVYSDGVTKALTMKDTSGYVAAELAHLAGHFAIAEYLAGCRTQVSGGDGCDAIVGSAASARKRKASEIAAQ
jgi:hypothetical protein